MTLFSSFECGNAKNIKRLSDRHWRVEAVADNAHYCYYFHFAVRNGGEAGHLRIDVHADAEVPEAARSFQSHLPFQLWLRHTQAPGWQTIPVLRTSESAVRIEIGLDENETVALSRTLPFPHSQIEAWLNEFLAAHESEVERVVLGASVEGRAIVGVRVPALKKTAKRILVCAGQHPAEFGGVRAVRGATEFLVSRLKESREAREKFEFVMFPTINPDGNVEGKNAFNAKGADLYRSFEGCAKRKRKSTGHEAQLLWSWLKKNPISASLNFHSYVTTASGGDFPWEGAYVPSDDAFPDAKSRERQQVVNDYLRFKTECMSQHGQFATHVSGSLEHNLAQLGIVSAFYEVQDSLGAHRNMSTGFRVLLALTQALSG